MKLYLIALILFALSVLTGCATLGISLETEYGKFRYELPEPKGTKK